MRGIAVDESGGSQGREIVMRLVVGGDHAGFPFKGPVVDTLCSWGHEVVDVGADTPEPVDFPDIAELVCDAGNWSSERW
jgi:ribose 5-phosphate isomerase RpiB